MTDAEKIDRLCRTVEALQAEVQRLRDRMEVRDVAIRLARGDDRLDKDILFTAYADDAIDDHLGFCGSREEFSNGSGIRTSGPSKPRCTIRPTRLASSSTRTRR